MSNAILEISELTYKQQEITMLKEVSFSLHKGESITIFGPEGCGMSHLAHLIININTDFDGDIYYKGRSIKDFNYMDKLNYKKDTGYLHGDFGLLSNMTLEQNVALPLEYLSQKSAKDIKKRINSLIYDLNLDHCKKLRPIDLTRSEILKTAYARATALDPDFLFMEHALENHCSLNILTLMDLIKERSMDKEKGLIVITYRPEKFMDISDKYIMFFSGKIVFQGTKKDFLVSDNPYLVQYRDNSIEGPMPIL